MVKKPRRWLILFVLFSLLVIGCGAQKLLGPIQAKLSKEFKPPRKVAILPFVNKTNDPNAASVVRKMFYNFFSSLNYIDVEPSIVDETLKKKNMYEAIVSGEPVHPAKTGQLFGVDAIITGEVTSFGKVFALIYTDVQAGLKSRMIHCTSGKVLWEHEYTAHIRSGELPLSLAKLAISIIKSYISHRNASAMKASMDLCMEMVGTIPNASIVSEPPPRIKEFVHNGAGRLLSSGDSLKVVLIGEPGQKGSWDISESIRNLPLSEKEPGVYIGAYRAKADDRVSVGYLAGRLKSKTGIESRWVDVLGPVTLGSPTTLPAKISEDTVLTPAKSPYLVNEALFVQEGVTMTIEPGTVIWSQNFGIISKGTIRAQGTFKNPIRFSGMGASGWKGILLAENQGENLFAHCEISGAQYGLRSVNSRVHIDKCNFQGNVWAVVLDRGSAKIQQSLIQSSEKVGISVRKGMLSLTGSVISENNGGGILLQLADATMMNNNISNNGEWELKVLESPKEIVAQNNWWGAEKPDQKQVIGPTLIEPTLQKPIDLPKIMELRF